MQGWILISFSSTFISETFRVNVHQLVTVNCGFFELKSIGAGGSVLSICGEFLSDRRQRVVVDGAVS